MTHVQIFFLYSSLSVSSKKKSLIEILSRSMLPANHTEGLKEKTAIKLVKTELRVRFFVSNKNKWHPLLVPWTTNILIIFKGKIYVFFNSCLDAYGLTYPSLLPQKILLRRQETEFDSEKKNHEKIIKRKDKLMPMQYP